TQLAETLYRSGGELIDRAIAAAPPGTSFRLIGIGVSALRPDDGADPPDLADPEGERRKRVETVIDTVRDKLGKNAISKGRSLRNIGTR
ncbi:MAG: DNA polymerase IV, partial [Alphaproteobacteria bacterium]